MISMKNFKLLFVSSLLCFSLGAAAQKFTLEKSIVKFYSAATIENIEATNTKAVSIFNAATAEVAFVIPIKEFEFEKQLMKEHFNEKYLESEKYPKATFQGKFSDFVVKEGEQRAVAQGKLTIHGVTEEIEAPGTISMTGNIVTAQAKFKIKLEDYKIKIPQLLWQNIAEEVEVTVEFIYKPQ